MDNQSRQLAIYGSGGFAREIAWLADECSREGHIREVLAFIDDDSSRWGSRINDITVVGLEEVMESHPDVMVIGGVGSPALRRRLMTRVASAGLRFDSLVHPGVLRSNLVEIGEGSVICAGSILTTNIQLGAHVQINLDCTIGHDVVLGDFTTLAPGVHVSGWVHFDEDAYVGTGASIINGTQEAPLVIGAGAIIGAGACVTKSVPAGVTAVGVPARPRD